MSGELEEYQQEDPLERAIKESGKQGLIDFAIKTLVHYGSSPDSDRNFEKSLEFGTREGLKRFLHSFVDQL